MRPTNLGFRSPKDKSGEFVIPQTHYSGISLNYKRRNAFNGYTKEREPVVDKRYTTFGGQNRFYYTKVRPNIQLLHHSYRVIFKMSLLDQEPMSLRKLNILQQISSDLEEM